MWDLFCVAADRFTAVRIVSSVALVCFRTAEGFLFNIGVRWKSSRWRVGVLVFQDIVLGSFRLEEGWVVFSDLGGEGFWVFYLLGCGGD